jgi:hypothetical protein
MDFLLAGTLVSFARGVQCRVIVQRSLTPAAFPLWKTFRSKPNAIPGADKKVFAFPPERYSLSDRNAVRNHNGMVFGFTPESRSPSTGFPTADDWPKAS